MGSRPAKAEAVCSTGNEQMEVNEQPPSAETQSQSTDAQPPSTEAQPQSTDAQPQSAEAQPQSSEAQPQSTDAQPHSTETQKPTDVENMAGRKKKSVPLTEERINQIINEAKQQAKAIVDNYTFDRHRENFEVRKGLQELKKIYFKFKDLAPEEASKSRREIGTFFVDSGLVGVLCEIVVDYLSTGWKSEDGTEDLKVFYRLYNAFILLFNYSDSTPAIPEASAAVPGFFEFIAEQLRVNCDKITKEEQLTKCEETMVRNILGFTHNSSAVGAAKKRQRELGYTKVLLPYLAVEHERYKMSSVLSLANLVNEEESALLNTSVEAVRFLLKRLGKALKDPGRRNMGWSAKELAHGVAGLASNDTNKKMLVTEGALPLLLELSFVENEEEQSEAVGAQWALSFDDQNKDLIIKEPGLINRLVELEKSPYAEVRKDAQGVLWTLRNKLKENSDYKNIAEKLEIRPDRSSEASSEEEDVHVAHLMISYQWDNQDTLIKVRDALKSRGYKTWMDVDYMGGSTLQAMAEAVENSAAVLICMSQRYKDSPNCRAEAEYAFQRRVPIIPLLMETDYRPDGWLGILLGAKLFFDFSGKYTFGEKIDGLLKEIGGKGLSGKLQVKGQSKPEVSSHADDVDSPVAIIPPVQSGVLSAAPPTNHHKTREVMRWGQKEVAVWLKENQLEKSSLSDLSGKELLFLRGLKAEAPETFYTILRKNLSLTTIHGLMTFVEALMKL